MQFFIFEKCFGVYPIQSIVCEIPPFLIAELFFNPHCLSIRLIYCNSSVTYEYIWRYARKADIDLYRKFDFISYV